MLDVLCVGHASWDIAMTVAHHPERDEKMLADAMFQGGGGPAANAAVQVVRLGGRSGFCGYLGRDIFGEEHLREFDREGVDTSAMLRGDAPSPISQVLARPDGCRSVVNFKGNTPWLPEDAVRLTDMPKLMLFDGHEPLLSERLCRIAKKKKVPTVLDAGSVHKGTKALAGAVDYLVASEKFARQRCQTGDMGRALDVLADVCANVVITLGAHGLIWKRNGQIGKQPAFAVEAVDSTGAGDAFHGAFALAVARDMAWNDALSFASAAGALTCTALGARAALPDAGAVSRLLASRI